MKKGNKLNIDSIPLKVKKTVDHQKKKKKSIKLPLLKEDKTSFQILSTVKVITMLVLLIISFVLIINIVSELDKNKSEEIIREEVLPSKQNASIIGTWLTENGSLFVFDDDNHFYWYENYEEQSNNYYAGTYTYKTSTDALEEMGYTEEDLKVSFEDNIELENVFSIVMTPTTVIKGRKDVSAKEIKKNETWWFLIIKKEDNTALAYNKTLDIRYNLSSQ
mgnify:CR=1 FL=1